MKSLNTLLKGDKAVLMGILNCTPDSFSDGGLFVDLNEAYQKALDLINDGASIIDIGGESTGPGAKAISAEEELARTSNIVEKLANKTLVSVDTYKSSVADKCLSLGAKLINDVSALRADPEMASVVASHNAYLVLMFSKESDKHPHASDKIVDYEDVIDSIKSFFANRIEYATSCGIDEKKIILDTSMGRFVSHDAKYSWEILKRLAELTTEFSDFPFLIGTSRKGFLGGELKDRDPISAITAASAFYKGAKIIRTHNVAMTTQLIVA